MKVYDAIVIGGGLAGCCTSIHLASSGHTVLLLERGRYPTHKLCGEFLSIEAADLLGNLGVWKRIKAEAPSKISSIRVTTESGRVWKGLLPGTAYGLSRYRLDQILFERSAAVGACVRDNCSVHHVDGNLLDGFVVHSAEGAFKARLVIDASGKRSSIKPNNQSSGKSRGEFVAFKQHYRGDVIAGAVQIGTFERGYCGINPIENRLVNICWLSKRSLLLEHGGKRENVERAAMAQNHHLKELLTKLTPVPGTLCALGGITLSGRGQVVGDICLAGDAAQMIAPFCGDGMSMALRSGELAAEWSAAFICGKMTREALVHAYASNWRREFSLRLALGKVIQHVALLPAGSDALVGLLTAVPPLGNWLVGRTRGSAYCAEPNSKSAPSIVSPGPNASDITLR